MRRWSPCCSQLERRLDAVRVPHCAQEAIPPPTAIQQDRCGTPSSCGACTFYLLPLTHANT
ncbi:MAG: hypothetical protein ACK56F_04935 [bacterium]